MQHDPLLQGHPAHAQCLLVPLLLRPAPGRRRRGTRRHCAWAGWPCRRGSCCILYGQLSGAVEPVVEELIPESQRGGHADLATMGAVIGFAVMMVPDVALG